MPPLQVLHQVHSLVKVVYDVFSTLIGDSLEGDWGLCMFDLVVVTERLRINVFPGADGSDVYGILIIGGMAGVALISSPHPARVFEVLGLKKLAVFGLLEVALGLGRLIIFALGSENAPFFMK